MLRAQYRGQIPELAGLLEAVVLGTVGYLFSRSHTGQNLLGTTSKPAAATAAPQIRTVLAFDPDGDRREHDADLPKLFDHDATSSWSTEHYDSGLGKPGVGVVIVLDGAHKLSRLQVKSPTHDWSASVSVADGAKDGLSQWGPVVDTGKGLGGNASFDLHGRSGAAVLLWITDIGANRSVTISELQVS